jgi:hypothetical protein
MPPPLLGRKLDDLDLARIHAVLLQDHLEQIDIGLGAADDTDAPSGELRYFRDLRAGLLAFDLGRRRYPQHRDVLAQRRHGLGIFRDVEIASDNGEVGLAGGQRLGARGGALGLQRAQPDLTVRLNKSLRQGLDQLEVVAVGGADRDPQRHRPHRKVVAARQRSDHREKPGQRDEHCLPLRRARRRRRRWPDEVEAAGHRSGKQSFDVQIHGANSVKSRL